MEATAAQLKEAGYASACLNLSEAKKQRIKMGYAWSAQLDLCYSGLSTSATAYNFCRVCLPEVWRRLMAEAAKQR